MWTQEGNPVSVPPVGTQLELEEFISSLARKEEPKTRARYARKKTPELQH